MGGLQHTMPFILLVSCCVRSVASRSKDVMIFFWTRPISATSREAAKFCIGGRNGLTCTTSSVDNRSHCSTTANLVRDSLADCILWFHSVALFAGTMKARLHAATSPDCVATCSPSAALS